MYWFNSNQGDDLKFVPDDWKFYVAVVCIIYHWKKERNSFHFWTVFDLLIIKFAKKSNTIILALCLALTVSLLSGLFWDLEV